MSPADEMSATAGYQLNHGCLPEAGAGAGFFSSHSFPLTGAGRNKIPSSAMNALNAGRVPTSFAILAKASSVATIDSNAVCSFSLCAKPGAMIPNNNIAQISFFISGFPSRSLIRRLRWPRRRRRESCCDSKQQSDSRIRCQVAAGQ